MNENDVKFKEDANDLVYDPTQDQANVATPAVAAPNTEAAVTAPTEAPAAPAETQPMTDVMPPVAPAVEATPDEVAEAQAEPVAPEMATDASAAASDALNAAADAADDNIVTLQVKFDKRDLLRDGFLVPDAEGASANPAAQIAANPNVEIPQEPLTSVGSVTESKEVGSDALDGLRESFIKDFFSEIAKSVIDTGKSLSKTEDEIQADLDAKLNTLMEEPMFQGIEISDDVKNPFFLNKEDKKEAEKESENPYDAPSGEDAIKAAGEEPGKSEFSETEVELPLHKEEIASEIAKSKADTYDSVSETLDTVKNAGTDLEGNKDFQDGSEGLKVASELLGEDQDSYKSVSEEKDEFKTAVSEAGAISPVKEAEEHEEEAMTEVAEGSEDHLEDVANADMSGIDIPVEEVKAVEEEPEEAKEPEESEECEGKECEDKSAEDLLLELDNILSDIYNGADAPAYNVNLNVNTNDKEEAIEGAIQGLQDIAVFVDAVLKDESPTDDEESEEDNPDVVEAEEEVKGEGEDKDEEDEDADDVETSEKADEEEEDAKIEESTDDKPEGMKIEDGYVYMGDDLVGVLGRSGEAIYNPLDNDHPEVAEYFMGKDYIIKFSNRECQKNQGRIWCRLCSPAV